MARRSAVVVLLALASCRDAPAYAGFLAHDAQMSLGTGSEGSGTTATTDVDGTTTAWTGSTAATLTSEITSGSEAGPTTAAEGELVPPRILAVDVPAAVHLAGPVTVKVTAEHATAVRARSTGSSWTCSKTRAAAYGPESCRSSARSTTATTWSR
ncbi:hypothetical protein [Nannocystis pusilla]|uniref:hypothetical protein n=1 Tax=Nannocystis pusilla TaxID=889268 RepID=UPI003B7FF1F6